MGRWINAFLTKHCMKYIYLNLIYELYLKLFFKCLDLFYLPIYQWATWLAGWLVQTVFSYSLLGLYCILLFKIGLKGSSFLICERLRGIPLKKDSQVKWILKKFFIPYHFHWALAYVSIKSSSKDICFHLTPWVSAFWRWNPICVWHPVRNH